MRDGGLTADDGRLGTDVLAGLEIGLQDALNHPTRRDILRALHEERRPRSVTEILGDLAPLRRSEVAYHAQVLRDSECVAVDGFRPAPGGREQILASLVAASDQVQLILRATRHSDQSHRERTGADHSPGLLAMFRLPRRGASVRLLGRRRRAAEGQ
jgi:DNA-binding transcriptional ArsR family regulator